MEKEISIFIDESGDVGFSKGSSIYYIITMVIHNQIDDISSNIGKIDNLPVFHTGPIIRNEKPYKELTFLERKHYFQMFFIFFLNLPIKFKSFCYRKSDFNKDILKMYGKIAKDTYIFLINNFDSSYKIKIYYDNGQKLITKMLISVFEISSLDFEFKKDVMAKRYRLFQIADFISTMKLIELKIKNNELSKSELLFVNKRAFKNNYLKNINKKEIK